MKSTPTWNNYEITLRRAEKEFLRFDQEEMIRSCGLSADEDYIYITYFYAPYRIHRQSGNTERQIDKNTWRHCSYNEGMGIFDAICEPTPFRCLSGEMADNAYFAKVGFRSDAMYQRYADAFAADIDAFRRICLDFGAIPQEKSNAGFLFQVFDFLPVMLLLWEGEEGIPAALRFLWDKNTPDFLRYETTQIILGHILEELHCAMQADSVGS